MVRNPAFDPPDLPADRWYPPAEAKPGEIMARRAKYVDEANALHQELDILIEFGLGRKNIQYHIDLLGNIKRYLKEVNMVAWSNTLGLDPEQAKQLQKKHSDSSDTFSNSRAGAPADELSCSQICDLHQQNYTKGLCACPKLSIQQTHSQASSATTGSDQSLPQATPMKKDMSKKLSFPTYPTPDSIKQQEHSQLSAKMSPLSPQPSPSSSDIINASTQLANGMVPSTVQTTKSRVSRRKQSTTSDMNKKQPLDNATDMIPHHNTPSKINTAQQPRQGSLVTTSVSRDVDSASLQSSVPSLASPSGFGLGKRKRGPVAEGKASSADGSRKKARRTVTTEPNPSSTHTEAPPSPNMAIKSNFQHPPGRMAATGAQAPCQPETRHNTPDFLNEYTTSFQSAFNSSLQSPRLPTGIDSLRGALSQCRAPVQNNQSHMLQSITMGPLMQVPSGMVPSNAGQIRQGTAMLQSRNFSPGMVMTPNNLCHPPFQDPISHQGMNSTMGFASTLQTQASNTSLDFTSHLAAPEPWSNNTPLEIVTRDGNMVTINGMRNLNAGEVIDVSSGRVYDFNEFLDRFDERRAAYGLSVSYRNR